MSLRIYLVDDEKIALKYIHLLFEAVTVEYEIVGESTSSVTALKEIEQLRPDIVFSDICMPVMDGLALAEDIIRRFPIRFFLLTSHKDFEYVKKGIQLGVVDYLLKNELDSEMIQGILEKVENGIEKERRSEHILLEKNVREYLLNESADEYITRNNNTGKKYKMFVAFAPIAANGENLTVERKRRLDCYEIHEKLRGGDLECVAFVETTRGFYCGIFAFSIICNDTTEKIIAKIENVNSDFSCEDYEYKFIVSNKINDALELPKSYQQLVELSLYTYSEPEKQIYLQDLLQNKERSKVDHENALALIDKELLEQKYESCKKYFLAYEQEVLKNCNIWEYREAMEQVKHAIKSHAKNNYLNPVFIMPEEVLGIGQMIEDSLNQLTFEVQEKTVENCSPYVKSAIDYIKGNYVKDISVADIAEYVNISEGHLRRLFRMELGIRVIDYITDYRIDLAKKLIQGEHTTNMIWDRVGFSSSQYFSYVFQKKENMSPREFLKSIS